MKYDIKKAKIKQLNSSQNPTFPKYTTQLINCASQTAQATRPKAVGQLSELFPEYQEETEHVSMESWEAWYLKKHPNAIKEAAQRAYKQIQHLQEAIQLIDYDMVEDWVKNLVITKTYNGLYAQQIILAFLSEQHNQPWRLAEPEEESVGIDGYVGDTPYSIKPQSYKTMDRLPEQIHVKMIYYTKTDAGLTIEVDE